MNGQWWGVFFRVILTGIAFYVMGRLALAVCFLLVGAALGEPGLLFRTEIDTSYLPTLQALLAAVIPAAVQALVMPLVIGADLILWNDLRRKA
ncbi:hypothetical protein A3C96_02325 [Candidatus Uhrbacteria bacterium RIFCSPHIGHO2_02_FULL_60_10]|uniref:Uncharacterized protein n=1 Tax=Candidatus Uhrbacteria bacterium RIFCSPHIGHO2_02_FULL_60_10 TaxID=1802392 RepID=A0A1F7U5G7_9BACT|nr:MAG: hypothetical protein A3C96_02325 [Candidatus Uhrbacteria bacterium RIFCSPHIGHO2_02_FULL_60_10]